MLFTTCLICSIVLATLLSHQQHWKVSECVDGFEGRLTVSLPLHPGPGLSDPFTLRRFIGLPVVLFPIAIYRAVRTLQVQGLAR